MMHLTENSVECWRPCAQLSLPM